MSERRAIRGVEGHEIDAEGRVYRVVDDIAVALPVNPAGVATAITKRGAVAIDVKAALAEAWPKTQAAGRRRRRPEPEFESLPTPPPQDPESKPEEG